MEVIWPIQKTNNWKYQKYIINTNRRTEEDHLSDYLMQNSTLFISHNLIRGYKTHEHLYNYHQFLVFSKEISVFGFVVRCWCPNIPVSNPTYSTLPTSG